MDEMKKYNPEVPKDGYTLDERDFFRMFKPKEETDKEGKESDE